MSIISSYTIIGIIFLSSTVDCGLICREEITETPFWEAPCGKKIETFNYDDIKSPIKRNTIMENVKMIEQRLRLCMHFYKMQNFSIIYSDSNLASAPESEPWLREKTTIDTNIQRIYEIPEVMKHLYTSLQIFGMAFDVILKEESDTTKKKSIQQLVVDLRTLLCDLQDCLISLQIEIPLATATIPEDYKKTDETFRFYRDHKTIKIYAQHLRKFVKFLKQTRKRFRRRNKPQKKELH